MPTPNADPSCRATIDRAREVNALAQDRSPSEAERSIEVTAQLRVYARFLFTAKPTSHGIWAPIPSPIGLRSTRFGG